MACSDVARTCGVDTIGTGSAIRSWMLIEHAGPWPEDVRERVLTDALPPSRLQRLQRLWVDQGLRPLIIRRPGRAGRRPAPRRTVVIGSTVGGRRWLEHLSVTDLRELADLNLERLAAGQPGHGEPLAGPLLCVCTQGSVDPCCAVRGRAVVGALAPGHADRTWEVSHLGGCRFAANLLVLPDGVMHGTLDPGNAVAVADAAVRGDVVPDRLRGRTGAGPWSGGAEAAVRRRLGRSRLDDVFATATTEHPDTVDGEDGPEAAGADVLVRTPSGDYEVQLRRQQRPDVASTCAPEGTDTSRIVVTNLQSLSAVPPAPTPRPERTTP